MSRSFGNDVRRYVTGFSLSLIITLIAFGIVMLAELEPIVTFMLIGPLAALQVVVQSYFFLHIGTKTGSRLNAASYAFMIMTVAILVLGSLWVMANLNYNMTHDMEKIEQEIIIDEGMGETSGNDTH